MPLTDFRSVTRFRVPFCDIDMMQHANNAAYVVSGETARCVCFDEVLGVAYNYEAKTTVPIPEGWRERIVAHAGIAPVA